DCRDRFDAGADASDGTGETGTVLLLVLVLALALGDGVDLLARPQPPLADALAERRDLLLPGLLVERIGPEGPGAALDGPDLIGPTGVAVEEDATAVLRLEHAVALLSLRVAAAELSLPKSEVLDHLRLVVGAQVDVGVLPMIRA